jgi:hypothetical protein
MKRRIFHISLFGVGLILGVVLAPMMQLAGLSAAQQDCRTFAETGKQLCGRFLQYWQQNGGLPQQGYPISNEFSEVSELNGQPYTVQYFERAVFEMHPENRPPYDVLLSQLGRFQFDRKYPGGEPGAPSPTPAPPPPPAVGTKTSLKDGVTITLAAKNKLGATGVHQTCGSKMTWAFLIENATDAPFTLVLDRKSVSVTDNTGKEYSQFGDVCALGFRGAFPGPAAVPAKGTSEGIITVNIPDLPADAVYLDLRIGNISGATVSYRYPLR